MDNLSGYCSYGPWTTFVTRNSPWDLNSPLHEIFSLSHFEQNSVSK